MALDLRIRDVGSHQHATVVVEQIAARLAARLGDAQVDARVVAALVDQVGKVERRVAQQHGVGTNRLGARVHKARQGALAPGGGEARAHKAARGEADGHHALGVHAPRRRVRAHRGDHKRKVCLGRGIDHVSRGAGHVVEHKGLVAGLHKGDRHRLLLVRAYVREGTATADHHGRTRIALVLGHGICQVGRIGRGMLGGGLVSPQGMLLDNHRSKSNLCSFVRVKA